MANTIEYAKQYINNQDETLRMFNTYLLSADLIKRLVKHEGKVVSYDRKSFASYVMGTYDRDSGLSAKSLVFERVNKELTQDRGDALQLDIADQKEAQIAGGIEGEFNFYQVKVAVPTIDEYTFGKMNERGNGARVSVHSSLSSSTILDALFADCAMLGNKRVKKEECILYISATNNGYLAAATAGKGIVTMGSWNGDFTAEVKMFNGMKLVEVPDATLGSGVNWIIAHPLAVDLIPVLGMTELHTKIPSKPGMAQIDVRDYFDAWLQPNGEDGIIVSVSALRSPTLPATATFSGSKVVTITGIETGAKVYYTDDGSTPTNASTEYTAPFTLSATKTIKAIAILGSNSSDVVTATYTKS